MNDKALSISKRVRTTPFSRRVEEIGVKAYTVYNHMLLPTLFRTFEEDYLHLCQHVQVWDVSCERQVEIKGPDAGRLAQLMTPRDLSKAQILQGKYAPMCDERGRVLNDPIIIKLAEDRWWISIADSDIKLWGKGLAAGFGLDAEVFEPNIWPLAVQGPKAEELVARVFGEQVRSIRFFRGEMLEFMGTEMYVARSGWSKQGGFEIYLNDAELGEPLWDRLFELGADLNVGPGCPNHLERVESGLLSFGSDMTEEHNPFECGLDAYVDLDAQVESLSLPALRRLAGRQQRKLVGAVFNQQIDFAQSGQIDGGWGIAGGSLKSADNGKVIGEVTSQVWSPKYSKHLTMIMMQQDYLDRHSTVEVDGQVGQLCGLPFDKVVLNG